MKTKGKEKMLLAEKGQKVDRDQVKKWLIEDISKCQYVMHVILTNEKLLEVLADHFHQLTEINHATASVDSESR